VAANADGGRRSQTSATGRAVRLLQEGEIVALPTETVYGLAADALRPEAVIKIFEAKERPRFDPLIVHLPDISWLEKVADVFTQDKQLISRLTTSFWPGPITLVLPKRDSVPDIVTAGLETVAVRISAHPVLAEIIGAFGRPLAAPSANRFGRVSPTTAEHVREELDGRIPLIVDGGPTKHGLESTIVSIHNGQIEVLRPGPITVEDLGGMGFQPMKCESGPDHRQDANATIRAPGQLPSHYAPETPLLLIDDATLFSTLRDLRVGLLGWRAPQKNYAAARTLSESGDLREAAANLFRYLRELDALELDLIVAERVPEEGIGIAINDRLRRAAKL
jgi:L-threonylcarbamoyladenylate synthase